MELRDESAEGGLEQPSESDPNGDNDFDMFCDLEIDDDFPIETTLDEANLLNQCQVEMEAYLADQGIKLRIRKEHNKKKYNDPLDWSKQHKNKYPIVAGPAEKFLRIPASSAPCSIRTDLEWSRTSQVVSIKRASLGEDVSLGILYSLRKT